MLDSFLLQWMGGLFLASGAAAIYSERLAIFLGFISLTSVLAVFFSCRIFASRLILAKRKDAYINKLYQAFNKYHLYCWWTFGVSLVAHLMVAVLHTGLPQAGDPDSGIHRVILGLGAFSLIIALVLFSSCRVLPRLVAMATPRNPFNNTFYSSIYKYHSYYWGILLITVLAHFLLSYVHAGIWPGP